MQRKRAQVRRVEVLGATLKQIQKDGMAATRISDVAAALGVSPALIIYHFETKENLLVEALGHAAERDLLRLRRIMRQGGPPAVQLMAALTWYGPTGQARGWRIWVDAWAAAMRDTSMSRVLTDLQEQWTEEIAMVISKGVDEGQFRVDDAHDAATRITALLDGLAVRMVVHNDRFDRKRLREWLSQQVAWELDIPQGDLLDEGVARGES